MRLVLAVLGALLVLQAASFAAAQQNKKDYGPQMAQCACPSDLTANGRECGRSSAYCHCGGYEPICYPGDDDPPRRPFNLRRVCGHRC